MRKDTILFLLILAFMLFACGQSQRELAVARINEAKAILEKGDTLTAIQHFDSVKVLFPKASVQISVSAKITDELYRLLIDVRMKKLSDNDSVIANLEQKFTKEKTEFDKYMQYIPRRQAFSRSWNRSYLQVNLDERGEMFLTSHYMGKDWLNHTSIRVYDQGLQVRSGVVPLDDPNNRQSDFLDYKWEKVSYRSGKADSFIQFINQHRNLKLKCVFLGNRHYYILLEDYDVEAVVDALSLSEAIKRKQMLEAEIASLRKRKGQ